LIVPFLLTVIIGAMIVMLQKSVSLEGGQWGRFLAIIGLAMLYVAGIYSLSICVSCLTSRASTSVMLLLSVWVIFVLGIPNLSPYIARALRPAANAQEVASARRTAAKQTWDPHDEEMKAYRKAHGIPDRWWEKINWNDWKEVEPMYHMWIYEWPRRRKNSLHVLNEYKKIDQRYGRELNAQTELTRWIGRVSPFSCFALAATELADAGTMQNSRYMDQLRDYQVRLCQYAHDEGLSMEKKQMARKGKSPGPWYKHRDNPIPMFWYVPAAAGDYARKVAVDTAILAGVTVLLFMLSYLKFLRYDVR
jgi:hypothetical protein